MKQLLFKTTCLISMFLLFNSSFAQLAKCKGKYFGNIISGSVPANYTTYWNQVTSENASKWGSVEGTMGQYNFGGSDVCYNWAKNNNGIFKYHNLIWGGQTPGWVGTAATATITNNIDPYFKAVRDHYAPMGGLKMIDVLNEPVNTPMPGNLKAALTAGYKAEPANAGDLNNQYGWAIWCFQMARKYFPDATLLINEYNIEMNWNNCRAPYIAMVQAIKNAPNLTDGQKNLIDGVGLQAHGINSLTAANFKACIDEIWTKTGVAIHITEFDAAADPNEAKQQSVYSTLIPVAWEHPHVAGITLWGYIQGQTWIPGNKQTGASGTDSGIIYANGNDRPAMTWLKQYFASQPSLSCCPAPGPFASCTTTNPVPVVTLTAPTNNTVYTEGDNVTITATATITSGSISKVDFYNGTTLLGTDATSPYTYTITGAAAGNYVLTAVATSALNAATTSSAVNIQVAKPIYQTGSAPTIDGTVDALWSNFNSVSIAKNNSGTISSAADLSGNWKAMWDATNLYVLVQVTDDVKRNDGGTDVYNDDGVEVYIDMGNTKATTYGTNDQQYTFRWNDATAVYEINGHSVSGITRGITNTSTGYIVEVSIPWSTMGGTASVNALEGFEVMISDDDDGGARDGKLAWIATTDDTWSNPSLMGTVILKGLNCTAPTASITTTTPTAFCSGGSVLLTASAGTGYSYVWKNGTTTIGGATAQTYTATAAGSYTVTVTNSGGCSATSSATTVTVNTLPTITPYAQIDGGAWNQTGTATVCAGSTVVLGPQPTVTAGWSWTGPNGYTATTREITLSSITTNQSGNYTASYTDGNTCKASATFTLTVNAAPTAAITTTTPTAFCQGGSVVLTASAGSSYKWMNGTAAIAGATAQTYTATAAGSYTVEVTNANGCKATSAATTVTVNALPTAAITTSTPTTFCQGGSVVLTASVGSSYKWMNGTAAIAGATAQTYTATAAGSYTVEVTNANTCKATSTATTVTVNALPTATITTTTPTTFCQGGSVVLTASAGSSYKWMNGTTQVGTSQSYTATAAGSYTVEVTNAGNCSATSAATTVTVNTLPTAAITTTTPTSFCQGGSVVLTASAGSSYKWMNGTTQVGTAQSYTATTAGSYTVEVTNASSCKATSSATIVTVNALPNAPAVTSPVSYCQNASAVPLTATGSNLKWYADNTTATALGSAPTPVTTTAGTTNYFVSQTTNGCESSRSQIAVTVNALPTAAITTTTPTAFCQGGNVVLTASAGSSYKWMNGTTQVGTAQSYTATAAGSYTVEVTNANGCKATSAATTVTVNALPTATITASGPTAIPQGGSVDLTANTGSGFTYKWFKESAQVGTAQSYTATAAGAYTVEVTNGNSCSATSAVTTVSINTNQPSVITITSPVANATITGAIDIAVNVTDPDGSITLVEFLDGNTVIGTSSTAPYVYTWDNPSEGSHTITVRVTDSNGGVTTSAPTVITSTTSTGVQGSNTLNANIYPNPSNGIVFVDSDEDLSGASFMLIDVMGNEHAVSQTANGMGSQVDVSNLSDGTYILIVKKNDSVMRKKITVIK